ncbi:Ig-like domain-containing protein [Nocardioides sp. CFH 31398]|nr:Ig-like domain-containing protein [Nocardioides sp. CFH 31398]
MPDVATTYQWLRNDGLLRGATADTYLLTPDDVGDRVTVRVTGRRPGYDDAVVVSEVVVVTGAPAPVATTPPGTTGTAKVGETLTAAPGTWSVDGLTYSYQWLRDGESISGATRSSYRLATADAGRSVAVRVTARRTGYADGTATSPARKVARLPSTTTATPSATRVRVGRAVTVAVDVGASGATPSGTVSLLVDGTRKASTTLDADGEATLRYVPRSAGRDKLVVKYAGRAPVAGSQSPATTLTVVR